MIVDKNMQSLLQYGTMDFPFAFYRDEASENKMLDILWHWHYCFEFSYVAKGRVICELTDSKILLRQGEAVFINSGVLHSFHLEPSAVLENTLFEPEFLSERESRVFRSAVLPSLNSGIQHIHIPGRDDNEREVIQGLIECSQIAEGDPSDTHYSIGILGKVLTLWGSFIKLIKKEEADPAGTEVSLSSDRTRKMLYYIYTNYQNKIELSDIANAAGISSREALRCFSDTLHSSPIQYLNSYRVKCAERLLRSSTKSVTEIALDTGFDNVGYLGKVFKKHYGMSPMQYKKRNR